MTIPLQTEDPEDEAPAWTAEADRLRTLTDDELGDREFWAECTESYWRTDHLDPEPGSRWAEGLRRISESTHADRVSDATGTAP